MEFLRLVGNAKRFATPKKVKKNYIIEEGIKISSEKSLEAEYFYDLTVKSNRLLDENEFTQMQNAIKSVFVRYGDKVCDDVSLFNEVFDACNKEFKFADVRDIKLNYVAKRYVMEKQNAKDYVSDLVVLINTEQVKSL